jgi:hypothetical protein
MLTTILDALSARPERPARSACVPEMPNIARIIITADSDYVPSAPGHEGGGRGQRWRSTITLHVLADPVCEYGSFSYREALRSVHGPPEQCGQALIVSCAHGGS